MELLDYLANNFMTEQQLLDLAGCSSLQLSDLQRQSCMPKPSYVLDCDIACRSFFGEFATSGQVRYYAKSYTAWLQGLLKDAAPSRAFAEFWQRYQRTIVELAQRGLESEHPNLHAAFATHVQQEWEHFLNGTYGLCTKSGLPEDIAGKELAILIIKEIVDVHTRESIAASTRNRLLAAVTLLDEVSSEFAPHEVERSSRNRYINQVREKFSF